MLSHEVATRWYKAPELLLGSKRYDEKVDTWALGCVLAEAAVGLPVFAGDNDIDQLFKVFHLCGAPLVLARDEGVLTNNCACALPTASAPHATPPSGCGLLQLSPEAAPAPIDAAAYATRRRLWDSARLLPDFHKLIFPPFPGKDLARVFASCSPALVDLLQRLLVLDPRQRLSAAEVLAHPFLNRDYAAQRAAGEAPRDVWAWAEREMADEPTPPAPGATAAAAGPASPCSAPVVLVAGVRGGGEGEDGEDREVLQLLVQLARAHREQAGPGAALAQLLEHADLGSDFESLVVDQGDGDGAPPAGSAGVMHYIIGSVCPSMAVDPNR
jgi:hypothetical protein